MFGAFRPSAPLSGGLLWKIPWRLSPPQKLRQRRRLRRVDNIVNVLCSALQHQNQSSTPKPTQPSLQNEINGVTPRELANTADGRRMITNAVESDVAARRHGRGPKKGEVITESSPPVQIAAAAGHASTTIHLPTRLTRDVALENGTIKLLERWKADMPSEQEMRPRDKYTIFDKKVRGYRKGVHKLPKWTRVSQRLNPPGF